MSAPTPQTPSEARSAYSQIQRGGDIPVSGLRMTVPERPKGKCMNFNTMMCYRMKLSEALKYEYGITSIRIIQLIYAYNN